MEQGGKKIGYRDVLTQKEFLKNTVANLISRFGDSIDSIAFTWLVYAITGSAAWSAIVFAVNQLPSVIIQPFAGPLVEGMNKKRVMIVTDLIRGILVVGLAVLYLTESLRPWILLLFIFCNSTVEAFCMPASMAIIPKIIEEKYYTYGSSLSSTLSTVVQLIGIAAGGVIIGAFGVGTAIVIDGVSFFGSALIRAFIKVEETDLRKGKLEIKEYFDTLKSGAVYIKDQPVIRNFCLLAVVVNAIIVPINSLQTPLITEVMGQGSELLSVFSLAMMLGMGLGSFIFPFISEKLSARATVVFMGSCIGVTFLLFTLGTPVREYMPDSMVLGISARILTIYGLTVFASVLLGFSASVVSAVLNIQFMKTVEQEYLARVGSIFNASACAASPVASMLVSALAAKYTVSQIFFTCGILCVILFVVIGIIKMRLE